MHFVNSQVHSYPGEPFSWCLWCCERLQSRRLASRHYVTSCSSPVGFSIFGVRCMDVQKWSFSRVFFTCLNSAAQWIDCWGKAPEVALRHAVYALFFFPQMCITGPLCLSRLQAFHLCCAALFVATAVYCPPPLRLVHSLCQPLTSLVCRWHPPLPGGIPCPRCGVPV